MNATLLIPKLVKKLRSLHSPALLLIAAASTVVLSLALPAGGQTPGKLDPAGVTVIQAEQAGAKGKWTVVPHLQAEGGAYISATQGVDTFLEFPIEVDRLTEIAVSPVWFMHGDQRRAKRFPDTVPFLHVQQIWGFPMECWQYTDEKTFRPAPVVSKPGPDSIGVLGSTAYFTAPSGGRVGMLDLGTGKVTGSVDIGGYVADLLIDAGRKEVVVADASGNRVVFLDASGKKVGEVATPALPWSLALHSGKLFVACMTDKKVAVVDVASRKITNTIDLPLGPQNVEIVGDSSPQLAVRLLPMLMDMKDFKQLIPDRITYWPYIKYGQNPLPGEVDALKKVATDYPKATLTAFFCGDRPMGSMLDVGPSRAKTRSGYLHKPLPSKVYFVEPGSKAVTVLPAEGGEATKIELDDTPFVIDIHDMRLYAICKDTRKIHIIDILQDKVIESLPLPYKPAEFYAGCLVPRQTTVEQITSGPVINGQMPGRLAVGFAPLAFDPVTLAPGEPLDLPFFPYDRHQSAKLSEGNIKQLAVDNLHTIRLDQTSWIDVSQVTDRNRAGNPAKLMPGDAPGAVTLQVDGGPECDWENDVWFTPDYRAMLVRGSDEFSHWNDVRFTLTPGKHVLKVKATSPHANLDAIRIRKILASTLDVRLVPLPEDVHGQVKLPSYGGTFTESEPVAFSMNVTSNRPQAQKISCQYRLENYQGKTVLQQQTQFSLDGQKTYVGPLPLQFEGTGRFTLRMEFASADGVHEVVHRFVRLPKLESPRLIYRADETQEIKARIAKYPQLFKRYNEWLNAQSESPSFLPEKIRGSWGQDMYKENGKWRAICLQFSDMFLEAQPGKHKAQLLKLLGGPGGANSWQGNYEFGDAHSILMDLMKTSEEATKLFEAEYNKGNPKPNQVVINGTAATDYLLKVKEPLSERDRGAIYRLGMELTNYDAYFTAHTGTRGGNWWHGTTAWCRCPIHSMTRTFLWCKSFFGEKHFFERDHISGVLAIQSYAYPRYDSRTFLDRSAFRETQDPIKNTSAMRWALSGLSRMSLEKTYYKEVFDCIEKINDPKTTQAEVDELLINGCNVVIPMYVALGWLDPQLKGATWEEMPPSMIFDVEGAACMKSGWDEKMTDIYFVSGVKDISYRAIPNHFHVFKAGQMVVGTARTGDHGEPIPFYGNCVRLGDENLFAGYNHKGWAYYRPDERYLTDCHTTLSYTYMFRDWRIGGYRQEGTRWEGGGHPHAYPREVLLHSHTAHQFYAEGKVLGFETFPAFDYVAGDATNFWPLEDVSLAYRQFVYIRPDVMIVYDRLKMGANLHTTKWPLMILRNEANPKGHPDLVGNVFTSQNETASIWGQALLPRDGKVKSTMIGLEGWKPNNTGYIEIHPAQKTQEVEYLVALRVGLAQPAPLECTLIEEAGRAGVKFNYENKSYTVLFDRAGAVGGQIRIEENGKVVQDHSFTRQIDQTYQNWKSHPNYERWMKDSRFAPYVKPAAAAQAGKK